MVVRGISPISFMAGIGLGSVITLTALFAYGMGVGQAADELDAKELYFTWAYVIGTSYAILHKAGAGVIKYHPRGSFRWRQMLRPILTAFPMFVPVVFFFMPKFGRPTGVFYNDLVYAFLTSYTLIGLGSEVYDLRDWLIYFRTKYEDTPT